MSRFVSFPAGGDPRKKLDAYRAKILNAAVEVVDEACQLQTSLARQAVTDLGRVDRGGLRASIEPNITISPGLSYVIGTVVAGADYAAYVEYGRAGKLSNPKGLDPKKAATAAWPPVDVMIDWVRRHAKILAPSGRTKSGRVRRAKLEDVRSLAFLIGRKIARHGIAPSPFMQPAFERTKKVFASRWASVLGSIRP